ncbi:GAF domain-containing protein [Flexivirga oryzae]|uniref:GAF domain-containing protein n=1 Tax=Flexivirga oryzae TaxID=1794944 RepID=A0A839N657_9MICO|nr:GAF domain-containing protein [Flexivirga oryzae]MBB2891524.1 hypothetical protein [Flexivirga oryzae]
MTPRPAASMRAQVADSWYRSAAAGVDPDAAEAPITLSSDTLRDYRVAHPLARILPVLDDVLGEAAIACESLMAVTDSQGQLLWVRGHAAALRKAESICFVEGSNWDERVAGTNAPGMVLALNEAAQVAGVEHFRRTVQAWGCAAAPIRDPVGGGILGVLDVTGAARVVGPQTLAMVRAAARVAEMELARALRPRSAPPAAPGRRPRIRLEVLGRSEAVLTVHPAHGEHASRLRLSPRHSEILLLLAGTPSGLSGPELGVELYEEDVVSSTLRAEMTRLRALLGEELLESRPYRLAAEITSDWLAVQAHLTVGDVAAAMRGYRGPVLPRSVAPGACRVRDSVQSALREAVLRSAQPELMSQWTRSSWGADDYQMWLMQSQTLDRHSPLLPMVQGQLHRLDIGLGSTHPPTGR